MAITRDCRRELSLFGKQEVGSQTVVRRPSCVFCALQLWRLYDPVEPSDTQRTIVTIKYACGFACVKDRSNPFNYATMCSLPTSVALVTVCSRHAC